jgi:Zn-dependent protease
MENMLLGILVLIFSAIIHEVMHGFVAEKLGDPTPRLSGRLTLNPIPHIDPVMSIFLPLALIFSGSPIIFGAAKPVPINPLNLPDGKKDLALVALSGPLTNIFLAIIAALLIRFLGTFPVIGNLLFLVVLYNLILGILNLIPIPPLDGSRVFSILLPKDLARLYNSLESVGIFILFFLLLFSIGGISLGTILDNLINFSLSILGVGV